MTELIGTPQYGREAFFFFCDPVIIIHVGSLSSQFILAARPKVCAVCSGANALGIKGPRLCITDELYILHVSEGYQKFFNGFSTL